MASNSIASYLMNLGKSVKYAAIETVKEEMPVTSNFIVTNKETVRETYKSIVDSKQTLNKLGTIEDNTIFKAVTKTLGNIKSDVMSGNFYHPERDDPMSQMGALATLMSGLGDEGEEFASMLQDIFAEDSGDNPDFSQNPEQLITKGDAMVATSMIKVSARNTNCMAKLITRLHENKIKTDRAVNDYQIAQSQRQMILNQAGFNAMAQGFNAIIDFNNRVIRTHVDNSKQFYETITNLQKDSNSVLHELHELQKVVYKNPSDEKSELNPNDIDVEKLFKNGFDLKTYMTSIKQRIKKSPLAMMYNSILALPAMMQDVINNPMHYMSKQLITGIIGAPLRSAMQKLDKTISGAFSTGLARLHDFGVNNSKTMIGKIASVLGFKQRDVKFNQIDLGKYNKGPMSWNGIANKSVVEVIPGYLRRIEAALTGHGERIMDFQSGKWSSIKEAKNYEKKVDTKLAKEGTRDIRKYIADIVKTMDFASKEDRRSFLKAADVFSKGIYKKGYVNFNSINTNEKGMYGDNNNLVMILSNLLRGMNTGDLASVSAKIGNAKQSKINMVNGVSAENAGIINELANNSTKGNLKHVKGYNPTLEGNTAAGGASALLDLKDDHGNTLYDYHYSILRELFAIRKLNEANNPPTGGNGPIGPGPVPPHIPPGGGNGNNQPPTIINPTLSQGGIIVPGGSVNTIGSLGGYNPFAGFSTQYPNNPNSNTSSNPYVPYTRDAEKKKATEERAMLKYKGKAATEYGVDVLDNEQESPIDLKTLTEHPDSPEAQKMIEAFVKAATRITGAKDAKMNESNTNIFSSLFSSGNTNHTNTNTGLPQGINPNDSIMDQLLAAADMGQKFDVIRHNINALVDSPSEVLAGVVGQADKTVYNLLFGKAVGEVDKDGKPINGIFGKMVSEVESSMTGLNGVVDDITKNIKEFFGDKGLGSYIKDFLKDNLGFNLDKMWGEAKTNYVKPVVGAAKKAAGQAVKSTGIEIHNAFSSTMQDMGLIDKGGNFVFGKKAKEERERKEAERAAEEAAADLANQEIPEHAKGSKKVQSAGLAFISPGEAIIPANLNPWNPDRDKVDINAQSKNEDRMKKSFTSTLKGYMSNYGEGIPTHAKGNIKEFTIKSLQKSGLTVQEINSLIKAKDKDRLDVFNKITESHKKDKKIAEIYTSLKRLYSILTKDKYAKEGTDLKVSGGVHLDANQQYRQNWNDIDQDALDDIMSMSNLESKDYITLGRMREGLKSAGVNPSKFASDEDIARSKLNKREGPITGFRQGITEATGTDPVKAVQMAKEYTVKNASGLAKGGISGALLSAVFPLGGPLLGSLIGAGVSMLSKNESFQKYMFGDIVKDSKGNEKHEGGIISQKVMDIYNKYMPDAKKYGTVGAIAGLITPFGPLGGALIGAGASVLKNNRKLNNFLFGDTGGLLNKDRKAAIKRAFPHMAAAMLGTLFLGPFGLLGNAVLGSGIGLVSTTESFKRIMLGAKGRDGVRRGGIAGAIRRQITEPFKASMKDMREHLGDWFKKKVFEPVGKGLSPIGKLAGSVVKRGLTNLFNKIGKGIRGTLISKLFDRAFGGIRKAGGLGKWITKSVVGKATEKLASGVQKLGEGAERYAVNNGYGDMFSAQERADIYAKNGVKSNKSAADNAMAGMNDSQIEANSQLMELMNAHHNGKFNEKINSMKDTELDYFNNDLEKLAEGKSVKERDAINKIREELDKELRKGKVDHLNAADIASKISGANDLDKETKDKIFSTHSTAMENMKKLNARAEEGKNTDYMKNTREQIKTMFGLGNISDKELDKLIPELSRNLTNEVDVRRNKRLDSLDEEAQKAKENGGSTEEIDKTGQELLQNSSALIDSQDKTTNAILEMVEEVKTTNSILLGDYKPNTGKLLNRDQQMLGQRLTHKDNQTQIFKEAYGEAYETQQNKMGKKLETARIALDANDEKDSTIQGLSDLKLSDMGIKNKKGRNYKAHQIANLLSEFSAKKNEHGAKLLNADLVIDLADKYGVKKSANRIFTLSMFGYTIPEKEYETICKLSNNGYNAAKGLAKLGVNIDNFAIFSKIEDDKEGAELAKDMIALAGTKVGKDKSTAIAQVMSAEDIKNKLEDIDFKQKAQANGKNFQSMVSKNIVNEDELKSSEDVMDTSIARSENYNGLNGDKAVKDASASKAGDALTRVLTKVVDSFSKYAENRIKGLGRAVVADMNDSGDRDINKGDDVRNNVYGFAGNNFEKKYAKKYFVEEKRFANTNVYNSIQEEAKKNKDTTVSYDEFEKMDRGSAYKGDELLNHLKDNELDALLDQAPKGGIKDALARRINELKAARSSDKVEEHAFGAKLAGAAKAIGAAGIGGAAATLFGSDDKKKEDKEDSSDSATEQTVQETPKAALSTGVDSNAIAAIANSTKNDSSGAGAVQDKQSKDGSTLMIPTGDGDVKRYGKSRVDGSLMEIHDKNNMAVDAKIKHKNELQERSTIALENIAKRIGANKTVQGVAKKGKGLFDSILDMLKMPFKLPFTLLDMLIPGLGATLYAATKNGVKKGASKGLELLTENSTMVKGARQAITNRIAEGGILGGLASKLFGGLALNAETGAANAGEHAAESAAAKAGEHAEQLSLFGNEAANAGEHAAENAAGSGAGKGILSKIAKFASGNPKAALGLTALGVFGADKVFGSNSKSTAQQQQMATNPNMPIDPNMPNNPNMPIDPNNPNNQQNESSGFSTLANVLTSIGGYKAGKSLFKNHKMLGGGVGSAIGGALSDFITTGKTPDMTDMAKNIGISMGFDYAGKKLFGGTTTSAAANAGEHAAANAAANAGEHAAENVAGSGAGKGILSKITKFASKSPKTALALSVLGALGANKLFGANTAEASEYNPDAANNQPILDDGTTKLAVNETDKTGKAMGTKLATDFAESAGKSKTVLGAAGATAGEAGAHYATTGEGPDAWKLLKNFGILAGGGYAVKKLLNTNANGKLGLGKKGMLAVAGLAGLNQFLNSGSGADAAGRTAEAAAAEKAVSGEKGGLFSQAKGTLGYLLGSSLGSKILKGHGIAGSAIGGLLGSRAFGNGTENNSLGGLAFELGENAAFGAIPKIYSDTKAGVKEGKGLVSSFKGALGNTAGDAKTFLSKGAGYISGLASKGAGLATDVGSKALGAVSDAGSGIKSVGSSAISAINGNGPSITEGTNAAKAKAAETMEKGSEILTKIKDGLDDVFSKLSKWIPEKAVKCVDGFKAKLLSVIAEPKNLAKGIAKLARQGASFAVGAGTLGIGYAVMTGAFAIKDFYDGYNDADNLLKLKEGTATTGMKIVCGLVSAIFGAIPFIGPFIPIDTVLELGIKYIGPAFGFGEDELNKLRSGGEDTKKDNGEGSEGENSEEGTKDHSSDPRFQGKAGEDSMLTKISNSPFGIPLKAVLAPVNIATKAYDFLSDNTNNTNPTGNPLKNNDENLNEIDKDQKTKLAAQAVTGKIKDGIDQVIRAIQKFLPSNIISSIPNFTSAILDEVSKPQNIQRGFSKLSKNSANNSSAGYEDAESTVSMIYISVDQASATSSFIAGNNNSSGLLDLPPGTATTNMKILCGIVSSVFASLPFLGGFIAEDKMMDIALDSIGPSFGFSKKDIDKLRRNSDKEDKKSKDSSNMIDKNNQGGGSEWAQKLKVASKGIISNVISGASSLAGTIADKTASLAETAKEGAKSAVQYVKDKASGAMDLVSSVASKGAAAVKSLATGVWESAKNVASNAWEGAKSVGGKIVDTASSIGSSAYNAIFGKGKNNYGTGYEDISDTGGYTIPDYNKISASDPISVQEAKHQAQIKGMETYKNSKNATEVQPGQFASQLNPLYNMSYNAPQDSVKQSMKDSGCGPVSAVNALSSLGIKSDPKAAAQFALSKGYKEQDGGTMPGFFNSFMKKSGAEAKTMHTTKDIKSSLQSGNPVVLMGKDSKGESAKNPFAENPHYVTATGLDNNGNIIVQDPESNTPNKKYKANDVLNKSTIAIGARKKSNSIPSYNKIEAGDSNVVKKAKTLAQMRSMFGRLMGKRKTGAGTSAFGKSKYGRGEDTPPSSDGKSVPQYLWDFLIGKGLSSTVTAAILGNISWESGGFDLNAKSKDGYGSYGLCQWTADRKTGLMDYADSVGLDSASIEAQAGYLWHELQTTENAGFNKTLEVGKSGDLAATTDAFCFGFERPNRALAHMPERIERAQQAFDTQGQGMNITGTYTGGSNGSSSSGSNNSGSKGSSDSGNSNKDFFQSLSNVATIVHNTLTPGKPIDPSNPKNRKLFGMGKHGLSSFGRSTTSMPLANTARSSATKMPLPKFGGSKHGLGTTKPISTKNTTSTKWGRGLSSITNSIPNRTRKASTFGRSKWGMGEIASPEKMWALANWASPKCGVDPQLIFGQWYGESGGFSSALANSNLNFGGLTQKEANDSPQPDGNGYYMKFDSPEDYAEYFAWYLNRCDGVAGCSTVEEYATALQKNGYFGANLNDYISMINGGIAQIPSGGTVNKSLVDESKLGKRDTGTPGKAPAGASYSGSSNSGNNKNNQQQKKDGGLMGALSDVASILHNAISPWDASADTNNNNNNSNGNNSNGFTSKATKEGIKKASEWAESIKNDPNVFYGDSGCTGFAQDYLKHAGIDPSKTDFDMYVPTMYSKAKQSGSLKSGDQPASEGDLGMVLTDSTGDGPCHAIIADGQGGYWGNSTGRKMVVHDPSIASAFNTTYGFLPTGDESSGGTVSKGETTRTLAEQEAEAGPTAGKGKHSLFGRGKYLFGKGDEDDETYIQNPTDNTSIQSQAPSVWDKIADGISNNWKWLNKNTEQNATTYQSSGGEVQQEGTEEEKKDAGVVSDKQQAEDKSKKEAEKNKTTNSTSNSSNSGGKFGFLTSMASKMAGLTSGMWSAFKNAAGSFYKNSGIFKSGIIKDLFGDNDPILSALGFGSETNNNNNKNNGNNNGKTSAGGHQDITVAGNCSDTMVSAIPSGEITSEYGEPRGSYTHSGIDVANGGTPPVPTPVAGVVHDVGTDEGGYGNYVQIQDAAGNYHIFGHLTSQSVSKDQQVQPGDIIGIMGSTGHSSGNHVHYQIDPPGNEGAVTSGEHINPHSYAPPAAASGKFGLGRLDNTIHTKVSMFGKGIKYPEDYSLTNTSPFESNLDDMLSVANNDSSMSNAIKVSAPAVSPEILSMNSDIKPAAPDRLDNMDSEAQAAGYSIPEYNRINDADPIEVKRAKLKAQQRSIEAFKQNISKMHNNVPAFGMGINDDLENANRLKEVPKPKGDIFPLAGNFGITPFMQKSSKFGMGTGAGYPSAEGIPPGFAINIISAYKGDYDKIQAAYDYYRKNGKVPEEVNEINRAFNAREKQLRELRKSRQKSAIAKAAERQQQGSTPTPVSSTVNNVGSTPSTPMTSIPPMFPTTPVANNKPTSPISPDSMMLPMSPISNTPSLSVLKQPVSTTVSNVNTIDLNKIDSTPFGRKLSSIASNPTSVPSGKTGSDFGKPNGIDIPKPPVVEEPKPSSSITDYHDLTDVGDYQIPEYNLIKSDDSLAIKRAKYNAQVKGYEAYKASKTKEETTKNSSTPTVGPTPSDATKVSKQSNETDYQKLADKIKKDSEEAKRLQNTDNAKNMTIIDGVAPNGKNYEKNDIDYLLKQGYTKEDALAFLAKDKKYAKPDMAPNGKPYENNDINYLLKQGYTKEDALAFLAKDKKYAKPGDATTDTTKSTSTTTKTDTTTTSTNGTTNTTTQSDTTVPNADKLDALIKSQEQTNQILGALFKTIAVAVEKYTGEKQDAPQLNTSTRETDTNSTKNIKAVLSAAGGGSSTGIGDFVGANRDHSDFQSVINSIISIVRR